MNEAGARTFTGTVHQTRPSVENLAVQ
jgi:hypothetical protein